MCGKAVVDLSWPSGVYRTVVQGVGDTRGIDHVTIDTTNTSVSYISRVTLRCVQQNGFFYFALEICSDRKSMRIVEDADSL